jgi:beta-galactosidase
MKLLKHLILFCLIAQFTSFSAFSKVTLSSKINFNADWKFKLIDKSIDESNESFAGNIDDSGWQSVSLPHTAHLEPLIVNNQWQGICWYRKSFKVPKSYKGKKVFIEFEAAMNRTKVWLNGSLLTTNQGGYLPIVLDLTNFLLPGNENIIAVRLDNTDNPVTGPKPLKILDFNMYGGLYRNAWLIVKDQVHISHPILANKVAGGGVFVTFPKISESESIVEVKTHIQNEGKISKSIVLVQSIFFDGKLITEKKSDSKTIAVGNDLEINDQIPLVGAKLWSPETPSLYRLETSVLVDGKVVDKELTSFGIRKFVFQNRDLYINGKKSFLRGVNRHQEYPFIGYALSDNAQFRDAKKIKDAGFDYIRLSHYPQSPAFLDACDELGLVVLDAILGWQYYADNADFREFCYRSAEQLIRRDRNHPCVLGWEVSLNETQMPIFFMEELNRITHAEYPGKNVYSAGWMDDVYDIFLQARQHRLVHYSELKNKPYSVSEYGDWEYYSTNAGLNQHNMPKQLREESSSRQKREYGEARLLQQCKNVQEAHNDNLNTPAFSDSYWVMYDYNRGYHDDIEYSGIMDIFRLPKFAYYFFQSQRNPQPDPMIKIASYWNANSPLNLTVYSNCDEVELSLNNLIVARRKPDVNKISTNLKHPPFTFEMKEFIPGTLKAVGYMADKKVIEESVKTPEKPVALKVWLDESGRNPQIGCNDVLFLYIAAVDKNGTVVPDFNDQIQLSANSSVEIMNVDPIKAEAGIATALLKIIGSNINVKCSSILGELKSTEFSYQVE